MKTKNNHGFTLIELLVVIGMVGILTAIAIPSMIDWREQRKLQGAANNLVADMQLARIVAVRESANVSVVFVEDPPYTYTIFVDYNRDGEQDPGDRLLRNVTMPAGVSLVAGFMTNNNRTLFNSKGMGSQITPRNGSVKLTNSAGQDLWVIMSKIGRLRIDDKRH